MKAFILDFDSSQNQVKTQEQNKKKLITLFFKHSVLNDGIFTKPFY